MGNKMDIATAAQNGEYYEDTLKAISQNENVKSINAIREKCAHGNTKTLPRYYVYSAHRFGQPWVNNRKAAGGSGSSKHNIDIYNSFLSCPQLYKILK